MLCWFVCQRRTRSFLLLLNIPFLILLLFGESARIYGSRFIVLWRDKEGRGCRLVSLNAFVVL